MKKQKNNPQLFLGNEAIALSIIENGCNVAASYPGTPASEILTTIARIKNKHSLKIHVEWSVNEKSAFEVALAASYMGCRSAVAMKQVGLNVALDSLMSAAYTGTIGGFLICSADDPGPYSSQTEQDSRMLAMFANIPVLDPATPQDAYNFVNLAYQLSEKYRIPVMLRPTTRICHARQGLVPIGFHAPKQSAIFSKDPKRWAATPRYRYILHKELNKKIEKISREKKYQPLLISKKSKHSNSCIIASGVAFAYVLDILKELNLLEKTDLFNVRMPYPLSQDFIKTIQKNYKKILILEETSPVIELQFFERNNMWGRANKFVPQEGELTPDSIKPLLRTFLTRSKSNRIAVQSNPGQRPSLCPGCPHRASFFAIKKAFPKGLFPGDIGCYTLGINLGAVDTCLCMGASINQAAGFFHALSSTTDATTKPIIATIGDSTFIHAGIPALINALYNAARFILVILDNSTTAMTGNQPTALSGIRADGTKSKEINLEKLLEGIGVSFLKIVDPYNIPDMISVLKTAGDYVQSSDGSVAVIVARHQCIMNASNQTGNIPVVGNDCTGCGYCINNFECPALSIVNKKCVIDLRLCCGCGTCLHVCPVGALKAPENDQ